METTTQKASGVKPEIATRPPADGSALTVRGDRSSLRGNAAEIEKKFEHYPESVRRDGVWLHFFFRERCNNNKAVLWRIARSLGLKDRSGKEPSDQYWYQVAGGHYFNPAGDVEAFKRYVAALRAYARRMEEAGTIPFIETENWGLFNDYVAGRRAYGSSTAWGAVEGETGSQKTQCGRHYEILNNHLETVHIEAPSRPTRARLVQKLAARYLAAASQSVGQKEQAIETFLKGNSAIESMADTAQKRRCIILDNVQRVLRPGLATERQEVFSYLHELQEETGCCIILTWVPTFRKIITQADPFWQQFLGRIGGEDEILRLEQRLKKADLLKFAREFNVADDAEAWPLLKKWGQTQWGIRILIHKLEKARRLATARRSKDITAAHLQQVDLEATSLPAEIEDEGGAS